MGLGSSKPASPETKAHVQQLIQENPVVVFSKTTCPYCTATKVLLKTKGVKYLSLNVDTMCMSSTSFSWLCLLTYHFTAGGSAIFSAVKEMTGQRTVPNIFISQKQIGGNSELQSLNKSGELDQLLKAAGAN